MMDRIIPGTVIALTVAFVLAILIASARGEPKNRWDRDHETHHELGWPERPHYLPSWERTQRRYLPSYQYELERRKLCGNMCDDVRERRDPFKR